jgi:hypothetical protein
MHVAMRVDRVRGVTMDVACALRHRDGVHVLGVRM